ncbi:AMP-binding protein, partial [Nocardia thailandica]
MTEPAAGHQDSYPPAPAFAAAANADASLYARADADREGFWAEQARRLHWHTPFTQVLDWSDAPVAKWFADGELNVAYNCLDRHVLDGHGDQVALYWEGEPGDSRAITYRELLDEVSRAANYFTELGLVAGDRIAVYMPMIPEAIVTILASARLGLTHSVVFAGFSPIALRQRVDDAEARLIVTTDGQWRRGKPAPLKEAVDEALYANGDVPSSVEHVLVVRRVGIEVPWTDERDLWWHETVAEASPEHEARPFPAEHPLFILYTSGTTGKPKGIL